MDSVVPVLMIGIVELQMLLLTEPLHVLLCKELRGSPGGALIQLYLRVNANISIWTT